MSCTAHSSPGVLHVCSYEPGKVFNKQAKSRINLEKQRIALENLKAKESKFHN